MHYEEALKAWGAKRLESIRGDTIDPATVRVRMNFREGFACCGGSNPECYCSLAESPSAHVEITGIGADGSMRIATIDYDEFDFAAILGEIVAAADGSVSG